MNEATENSRPRGLFAKLHRLSPMQWFVVAMICFLPLHIIAVMLDEWATRPPLPLGDGPDYEAIGFCLSRGKVGPMHTRTKNGEVRMNKLPEMNRHFRMPSS